MATSNPSKREAVHVWAHVGQMSWPLHCAHQRQTNAASTSSHTKENISGSCWTHQRGATVIECLRGKCVGHDIFQYFFSPPLLCHRRLRHRMVTKRRESSNPSQKKHPKSPKTQLTDQLSQLRSFLRACLYEPSRVSKPPCVVPEHVARPRS